MKVASSSGRRGFTLIELSVVVVIIAVLVSLLIPNISSLVNRSEKVVCSGKLKHLWTAFSVRVADGSGWPQLPTDVSIGSLAEQQWWISSSASMGLTTNDWKCPSISRAMKRSDNARQQQPFLINYLPTIFDPRPTIPGKWGRMPWFTEISDIHGGGNLSVRADGSVCPASEK
jgi:prepilin-type N-terminal cleavage/methylation domain-containing protein